MKHRYPTGRYISREELGEVLSHVDGFAFNPDEKEGRIIRRLLAYNEQSSRYFDRNKTTIAQYTFRFTKNVCFIFRALFFFQEFFGKDLKAEGVSEYDGFWDLIRGEVGTLFETPQCPEMLMAFLKRSRDAFLNAGSPPTNGWISPTSNGIQSLVLHWCSGVSKSQIKTVRPSPLSREDIEILTARCSEWRELVKGGGLVDGNTLTKFLDDIERTHNVPRFERPGSPIIRTQASQPGTRTAADQTESASESDDSVTFIGQVKLKRRRCSDSDSPEADELSQREVDAKVKRRERRSQSRSPRPNRAQTTPEKDHRDSINPEKLLGSNRRFEELDKRLSNGLKLQLQHGTDITSLDSRLQSMSNQIAATTTALPDIRADITELNRKAARNADKISALEGRASSREDKEHIENTIQRQLKMTVAEALHTELPRQLDTQLSDLVQAAVSRLPIQDLVRDTVSRLPIQDLIRDAVSRLPVRELVQTAVRETSAPRGPRIDTRDGVIDRQRDVILQLSEQVQNLERERSRPVPPPYRPPRRRQRPSHHGGGGVGPRGEARRRD